MMTKYLEIFSYVDAPYNYPDSEAIVSRSLGLKEWPHTGWHWIDLKHDGRHRVGMWPITEGKTIRLIDVFTPDRDDQWCLDRWHDGEEGEGEFNPTTAAEALRSQGFITNRADYDLYIARMQRKANDIIDAYEKWYSLHDGNPVLEWDLEKNKVIRA